jgi:cation diffusion facilitator family transporter
MSGHISNPMDPRRPPEVDKALHEAERLEWQTLFWLVAIVIVMGVVAGGSQAFRTAWIEDMLSLLAPAFFLITRWIERLPPSKEFPYGFFRAGSLAFFLSAAALAAIGGFLLYEGAMGLIKMEHPSIGSRTIFEHQVWLGWLMIGALVFSVIPPVILGRKKRKLARQINDEVLYIDADTNAADWQTGVAGIAGVLGIALGLWWADSAMAVLISLSILKDGLTGLRLSTTSLLDGAPRKLGSMEIEPDADRILDALGKRYSGAHIQIRETGRYFRAMVSPQDTPHLPQDMAEELLDKDHWRLIEVGVAQRGSWPPPGHRGDKPGGQAGKSKADDAMRDSSEAGSGDRTESS